MRSVAPSCALLFLLDNTKIGVSLIQSHLLPAGNVLPRRQRWSWQECMAQPRWPRPADVTADAAGVAASRRFTSAGGGESASLQMSGLQLVPFTEAVSVAEAVAVGVARAQGGSSGASSRHMGLAASEHRTMSTRRRQEAKCCRSSTEGKRKAKRDPHTAKSRSWSMNISPVTPFTIESSESVSSERLMR